MAAAGLASSYSATLQQLSVFGNPNLTAGGTLTESLDKITGQLNYSYVAPSKGTAPQNTAGQGGPSQYSSVLGSQTMQGHLAVRGKGRTNPTDSTATTTTLFPGRQLSFSSNNKGTSSSKSLSGEVTRGRGFTSIMSQHGDILDTGVWGLNAFVVQPGTVCRLHC